MLIHCGRESCRRAQQLRDVLGTAMLKQERGRGPGFFGTIESGLGCSSHLNLLLEFAALKFQLDKGTRDDVRFPTAMLET